MDWLPEFPDADERNAFKDRINASVDRLVRRYGGPHVHGALFGQPAQGGAPARGGLLQGLAELSPAADVRDMMEGSAQTAEGVLAEDPLDALAGAGLLGAALVGTAMPGSAGGARKAAQDIVDARKATEEAPRGIRAYHGSPHSFERFSTEHIGTGEGAQAYGHGLYFAEAEDVARAYKEALSPGAGTRPADTAARFLDAADGDYDKAYSIANRHMNELLTRPKANRPEGAYERMLEVQRLLINREPVGGSMYEVNIRANPEDFLDWDAPLSEQSQAVQGAFGLENADALKARLADVEAEKARLAADRLQPSNRMRDEKTWFRLADESTKLQQQLRVQQSMETALQMLGSPEFASEQLRQAGIPGIRYYDAGSRGAGEGTRNYVVFDDSLIEILRKYGLAPIVGGGAAALAFPQDAEAQGGLLPDESDRGTIWEVPVD